jgi:hypothetical protein
MHSRPDLTRRLRYREIVHLSMATAMHPCAADIVAFLPFASWRTSWFQVFKSSMATQRSRSVRCVNSTREEYPVTRTLPLSGERLRREGRHDGCCCRRRRRCAIMMVGRAAAAPAQHRKRIRASQAVAVSARDAHWQQNRPQRSCGVGAV